MTETYDHLDLCSKSRYAISAVHCGHPMTTKTFRLEFLGLYKFELLNLHLDFAYD